MGVQTINAYEDSLTVVISTLRQHPVILEYLDAGPYVKVFSEWVEPNVPLPYVVVSYYTGGHDNDAQSDASDVLVKVCAFTEADQATAKILQRAIHDALHNQVPDSAALDGAGAYAAVYEVMPYVDTYLRQNRPYHERGGIYRVRLAEIRS